MYSCSTGDFFNDSIPEAELYILSKILHDWDDDKCRQLLAKVYKACKLGRCELLKHTSVDAQFGWQCFSAGVSWFRLLLS